MTNPATEKRAQKAQDLEVIQIHPGLCYVESSDGKVCYRVNRNGSLSCTCADYVNRSRQDPDFQCKHILAVLNTTEDDIIQGEVVQKRSKPKLDDRFMTTIQGRDFVVYSGLLDLAHQHGLLKLEVEPLQIPTKENGHVAICRAVATSKDGRVFSDIGDADTSNVNRKIAPHILRMASTRAKARALRDLANIGITCLEELGEMEDVLGGNGNSSTRRKPRKSTSDAAANSQPSTNTNPTSNRKEEKKSVPQEPPSKRKPTEKTDSSTPRMSEAQKRAISNLARRRGLTDADVEQMATESFGMPLENLNPRDAASLIRLLQQSA